MIQIKDLTSYVGLTKKEEGLGSFSEDTLKEINPQSYGEKIIEHTWTAPTRAVKEISPKSIKTMLVIAIAVSLLFALMQEFILIIVIASAGFLAYMLSQSPVGEAVHEVSTHGLLYAKEQFYYWHELKRFFFKQESNALILCVDTQAGLPGRIFLNINPADKDKLKDIFAKRLPYLEKEPKDIFDKMYSSTVSKFSLDK